MSEQKEPARILYEKTPDGANVQCRGTGYEILAGLVRIIYSASVRLGFDVDRFATILPALVALEKATLSGTELYDLDAIKRVIEGTGNE